MRSCTLALAAVIRVRELTPTSTSDAAKVQYVGISAAATEKTPKAMAAPTTSSSRGCLRRTANSAPPSVPMAITEPSRPYSLAPLPNSSRAISAVVIWKLKPNVPTMPMITRTRAMSGRCRT